MSPQGAAMRKQDLRADSTSAEDERTALLGRIDAYWRAANYLSVGQIGSPNVHAPLFAASGRTRCQRRASGTRRHASATHTPTGKAE